MGRAVTRTRPQEPDRADTSPSLASPSQINAMKPIALGSSSSNQECHMKAVSLGAPAGRSARIARQPVPRSASRRPLREALKRIFATLREWRQRSRERAELAKLDDRMLRDIGVTRGDVCREINKPFWRQ